MPRSELKMRMKIVNHFSTWESLEKTINAENLEFI